MTHEHNGETKSDRPKQVVKLTFKALCEKLERLQSTRRAKLNKASNLKKIVKELMPEKDCEPEVKCTFLSLLVCVMKLKHCIIH